MRMPVDQQAEFDSLQGKSPKAWLDYVRQAEESEQEPGVSLRVIWGHSARLAKELTSLEWAEVAIHAAELDAHRSKSGPQGEILHEDAVADAMALRTWFISKMGSRDGHPILDKHRVLNWIKDGLPTSSSQYKESVAAVGSTLLRAKQDPLFKPQAASELRTMRRVKRRLTLATELVRCGELVPDTQLQGWLDLLHLLP